MMRPVLVYMAKSVNLLVCGYEIDKVQCSNIQVKVCIFDPSPLQRPSEITVHSLSFSFLVSMVVRKVDSCSAILFSYSNSCRMDELLELHCLLGDTNHQSILFCCDLFNILQFDWPALHHHVYSCEWIEWSIPSQPMTTKNVDRAKWRITAFDKLLWALQNDLFMTLRCCPPGHPWPLIGMGSS